MILIISHIGFKARIFVLIFTNSLSLFTFDFSSTCIYICKLPNITYQTSLILFSLFGTPLYRNYNEKDEYSIVKGSNFNLVLIEMRVRMTFSDISTDLL